MKLKKRPITDLFGYCMGYECPEKQIAIVECQRVEADEIIIAHHYSHKVAPNTCINLLVIYKGQKEGALQIGYGIRPQIKDEYGTADDTREFDRMYLSDVMPKFSETIVLSLLTHYLRAAHPEIKHLVSYADTSAGKSGTIYRAGNYRFVEAIKADFYILADGERVHPVTMWHRHKTREWSVLQSIYPGIRKADGHQLKFIYDL